MEMDDGHQEQCVPGADSVERVPEGPGWVWVRDGPDLMQSTANETTASRTTASVNWYRSIQLLFRAL